MASVRFLRAPFAAVVVVSSCLAPFGCGAERVIVPEDDPDTGTRTLRDGAVAPDGAKPEADARVASDAALDAAAPDASDGATLQDARADAAVVGVTISEVFAADILSRRFVEIAGPASTPLGELKLRIADGAGVVLKTVDVANTASDVMPARGTWVTGGLAGTSVDHGLLVSAWDLPSDNGTVQLVRVSGAGTTVIDVVGYGTAAAQLTSTPTTSREGAAAGTPGTKSLLRKPPQVDTGSNIADFCLGASSPNAANVCDL